MTAPTRYLFAATGFVIALASSAHAGIVFEQLPNRTGGQASDTDFIDPGSNQPFWQLEADNVQIDLAADIRRITWWGFYGGDFDESPTAHDPPTGDETMRVRFYAPRESGGLPDSSNILFEESFLNPLRTATGFTVAVGRRPHEYQFEVDLSIPFHLEASTLYWLEIVQVGDPASHFRWERGTGILLGRAFNNPIVTDWRATTGSFALQLSTIPEPGTGFLMITACTYLCLTRWGRRRKPRA